MHYNDTYYSMQYVQSLYIIEHFGNSVSRLKLESTSGNIGTTPKFHEYQGATEITTKQ